MSRQEDVGCPYIFDPVASLSISVPYRPVRVSSARYVLVAASEIIMATIIESGLPATVEVFTNGTQNDVPSQANGILSAYLPSSNWQIAVTALLILIAYDQCMSSKLSQELQHELLQFLTY